MGCWDFTDFLVHWTQWPVKFYKGIMGEENVSVSQRSVNKTKMFMKYQKSNKCCKCLVVELIYYLTCLKSLQYVGSLSRDQKEPLQVLVSQMSTHMVLTVSGPSTFNPATLSAWHSLHLTYHFIAAAEWIILKYMTTALCKNWEGEYVH